jgi:hypothetical protein
MPSLARSTSSRYSCSLSRIAASAWARCSDSQHRATTVLSSSISAGVHTRAVAWCTAIAATNRPPLCSGRQMTAVMPVRR